MTEKNYKDVRNWLREYRIMKKELETRVNYLAVFRKTLIKPLPETEETLHRIYNAITKDMQTEIVKLRKKLRTIEKVLNNLTGPERSVLYHRYIVGIEWINMPEYLLYEQRSCQIYEVRALKKIAKMKIDWEWDNVE